MRYVHFGSSSFDPLRWVPIRNAPFEESFEKPAGGLWASPVDAELRWDNWCRGEDFNLDSLKKYFEFELSENAKVLRISSEATVKSLPRILNDPRIDAFVQHLSTFSHHPIEFPIDFEQLSKNYDVIEFLASALIPQTDILPGWDVDCILVLNKDVVCVSGLKRFDWDGCSGQTQDRQEMKYEAL